ncbi:DUF6950 family protein [Litorimonas haliclonae]|uniref:DUF6950 family protein n=1 Tax=Litorimonas haliclonae TaxID=2081977 RepID=UPI0039EEF59A
MRENDGQIFEHGQWDCLIYLGGWIGVETGRNPATEFIGTYSTEFEAARIMHRQFGGGLHETISHFATPVDRPRTGDLVIAQFEGEAAAIVNGPVVTGLGHPGGFASVGRHALVQGYRINA